MEEEEEDDEEGEDEEEAKWESLLFLRNVSTGEWPQPDMRYQLSHNSTQRTEFTTRVICPSVRQIE